MTDFDAPQLDIYARLTENQLLNRHEPEKGIFIAESPKVIERALDAGYEPLSFLAEERLTRQEGETKELLERCVGIPVYAAKYELLTGLTGFGLTRGDAVRHAPAAPALPRGGVPGSPSDCGAGESGDIPPMWEPLSAPRRRWELTGCC